MLAEVFIGTAELGVVKLGLPVEGFYWVLEHPKHSAVEAGLAKYDVKGVTANVADGQVTLTGEIPRAKLQDAMKAANEAGAKKVVNQLTIK